MKPITAFPLRDRSAGRFTGRSRDRLGLVELVLFLLPALAWVGFQAGRAELEVRPRIITRANGGHALRLSVSSTPPDAACKGGHVVWEPGFGPRLIETPYDSESCSD